MKYQYRNRVFLCKYYYVGIVGNMKQYFYGSIEEKVFYYEKEEQQKKY